jgi:hypothetical protein
VVLKRHSNDYGSYGGTYTYAPGLSRLHAPTFPPSTSTTNSRVRNHPNPHLYL